jgi:hypothetical protein
MGVFGWIGMATEVASISGSGGAERFARNFCGSYSVTLGDAVFAFYGERDTHVFGNDIKLVVNGSAGGIGGFLGLFLGEWTLPFLRLLGLGGDASFCYGARTSITYGGPTTTIQRGPVIRKSTSRPLGNDVGLPSLYPFELGAAQPKEPTGVEAADMDVKTVRAVTALSRLLTCATAASELAVRFKYPDYDPKKDQHGFDTPAILNKVFTQLSRTIMAVIYGIETASIYVTSNKFLKSNAVQLVTEIGDMMAYCAAGTAAVIQSFFLYCWKDLKFTAMLILLLVLIVILVLLMVGILGV